MSFAPANMPKFFGNLAQRTSSSRPYAGSGVYRREPLPPGSRSRLWGIVEDSLWGGHSWLPPGFARRTPAESRRQAKSTAPLNPAPAEGLRLSRSRSGFPRKPSRPRRKGESGGIACRRADGAQPADGGLDPE